MGNDGNILPSVLWTSRPVAEVTVRALDPFTCLFGRRTKDLTLSDVLDR